MDQNFFQNLGNSITRLFRTAADRYRDYYERENAKCRAAAKAQQEAALHNHYLCQYDLYADILAAAINNTAPVTGFATVSSHAQVAHKDRIRVSSAGLVALTYRALRTLTSDLGARDIQHILQDELDQLCNDCSCRPVVIQITFHSYRRVTITLLDAEAVRSYRLKQIERRM